VSGRIAITPTHQLQPREALPDKEQGDTNYSNDSSYSKETRMRVTTAEFIKGYGTLADKALIEPVTITKNGRDRLVLVSIEEYERLRRRDRRAFRTEDLSEADIALIAQAEAPPEHAHLDEELGDWRP